MRIIENAIPASLLRAAWATWPDTNWHGWHFYNNTNSVKYATRDAELIPAAVRECLRQMSLVLDGIIDDSAFPDWELSGAGMHMIPPGGHLSQHLDSDVMLRTGWRREYSCVLSVNPEWQTNWGGEFQLLNDKVLPTFNRMSVFQTTDDSYHEVLPITGPEPRCTIGLFYWSLNATDAKRTSALFT